MTDTFHCEALKCRITPKACVLRQDVKHGSGGMRGQRPSSHRMCDPEICAVGKRMRVVVEEAQRDEAGIPLEALDAVDELDLDDALEQLDVGAPAIARAIDEDREDTARDLYEPDVSQSRPADDLTQPDPGEREPATEQEEPMAKGEKKCACGATIRRDSSDGRCSSCRKAVAPKSAPGPKKPPASAASAVAKMQAIGQLSNDLRQAVAGLGNEDLAGLIEFARGLARERLRGADALQKALT